MKILNLVLVAAGLAAFVSCSSVKYGDAGETETVNIQWGSTDLQTFSQKMVKSLVDSPQLAYLDAPGKREDKRIIMYFGEIQNLTKEHVDTTGVSDAIEQQLLKSGRFRFVADMKGQAEIGDQVRFQNGERVDPEKAKKFGKQIGADMILYGALRSIDKGRGRSIGSAGVKTEDLYYQFVLKAVNIETGEIIWSDQDEIRKVKKTGLFGP